MMKICTKYTGWAVDKTGQPVPAEIQRIADCFVQLQEARHKADYNIKDSVSRVEAQTFVQMARAAFADWAVVAANPAADTYLTELLVGGIEGAGVRQDAAARLTCLFPESTAEHPCRLLCRSF